MTTAIIGILTSLFGIVGRIVGDIILAKWVGAAKFWWRQRVEPGIKAASEKEYQQLLLDTSNFQKDREKPNP